MNNPKLLLSIVNDLRSLADSVQAVAVAMANNEPVEINQPDKVIPVSESKPVEKPITLEQVRAVLAEKSQDGFTEQVRALLVKHGVNKLSELDQSQFPALLAEAEALK